jgi:LPS sulfotransferase NodH
VFAWKAVGHHLTWYPDLFPDPVAFLAACTADDGLLVVLRRRNFVTQALSLLHAEEHGYHFRGPGAAVFAAQRVEPERLLAQTQFYAEQDRWLAETARAVPSVELTYEDDLVESPSRQQALDRITGHLGLPPVRGGVDLVAVAPRSPAQRVANLDEVTAALAGTRWEGLLADA